MSDYGTVEEAFDVFQEIQKDTYMYLTLDLYRRDDAEVLR